jgi:hypothetical protein
MTYVNDTASAAAEAAPMRVLTCKQRKTPPTDVRAVASLGALNQSIFSLCGLEVVSSPFVLKSLIDLKASKQGLAKGQP